MARLVLLVLPEVAGAYEDLLREKKYTEWNTRKRFCSSRVLRCVKKSARRTVMSDRQGPSVVRETLNKPKAHHKPSLISLQEP